MKETERRYARAARERRLPQHGRAAWWRVFLTVFASLAVAGTALAAADRAPGPTASDREAAARYLANAFEVRSLPMAAAVIVEEGTARFVSYGRDAGGAPASPDTPFYIGSMSKAFTAAAVLQLAERGRIVLDAPVIRYLPAFRLTDPRGARITVRQLMNQTSGMANSAYAEWRLPQPRSLEEAVARLRRAGLAHDPGAQFSYHNPNYAVLARLVEVVSGRPFADYLRENIFAPLGMASTRAVDHVDEARDGAFPGHVYAFGRFFPVASPDFFVSGPGGVLTTPRDYAIWLQTQLHDGLGPNGARILTPGSIRASHTPAPNSLEYGFGWNRRGDRVSHSGGLPTYGAYAAMEGGDAVAVFVAVAPVTTPSREIALGALGRLHGNPSNPVETDHLVWIDYVLAGVTVVIWVVGVVSVLRSRGWAARWRLASAPRRALAFAPLAAVLAIILVGLPFLVSRVQSWSWIWLWFYVPVWTVALCSAAAAAAAVTAVRVFRILASLGAPRGIH